MQLHALPPYRPARVRRRSLAPAFRCGTSRWFALKSRPSCVKPLLIISRLANPPALRMVHGLFKLAEINCYTNNHYAITDYHGKNL